MANEAILVMEKSLPENFTVADGTGIEQSWKEIGSMQINIGDSWKEVSSAQINIGDSWKTIF
jgi:hypothetical protein